MSKDTIDFVENENIRCRNNGKFQGALLSNFFVNDTDAKICAKNQSGRCLIR